VCFRFKWCRMGKNIKKIRARSGKFGFVLVAWSRGELCWAFVLIVLCCFFLYDLLCLPSRCCPREEAQIWLLRHFTQSRDGALDFVLKLWIFYRPHLVSNGAENWCASYLSDTKLEKIEKNKSKKCKIRICTSGLTSWWALLSFFVDRVVLCLSFWPAVPS
jgi:hypothetical protein